MERAATIVRAVNPYVGPRSYLRNERLYGRDAEVRQLADTLIAERVVLLYSPSGAGKSSLIEAGLRPELEDQDFDVLPTIRVGHDVPPSVAGAHVRNRYTMSALLSLEEGRPRDRQFAVTELASMTFCDYVARVESEVVEGRDFCVCFDQFEELFTLDPTDFAAKEAFLADLGAALRPRHRWALFAMREDFIAQLDPYLGLMPTRWVCRYRLDLLMVDAALEAVCRPAADHGVTITPEAAKQVVDDLRRVRVKRGAVVSDEQGPYVEPVQLQVVCRQLWETAYVESGGSLDRIDLHHVASLGQVDDALGKYYESVIDAAVRETGVSTRELREWFDTALVSADGFRTQALEGPGGRHSADVLRWVVSAHIVRSDSRRGTLWYELAHDRLVAPVRASNARWRDANLGTVQLAAAEWEARSQPRSLLLTGAGLLAAQAWAEQHRDRMTPLDLRFLEASEIEQERLTRERRSTVRVRRFAVLSCLLAVLAVIGLVIAVSAWRDSQRQATIARDAEQEAQTQRSLAEAKTVEAQEQRSAALQLNDDLAKAKLEADSERDNAELEAARAVAAEEDAKRSAAEALTAQQAAEAERQRAEDNAALAKDRQEDAEWANFGAILDKARAESEAKRAFNSAIAAFGKQIEAQAALARAEESEATARAALASAEVAREAMVGAMKSQSWAAAGQASSFPGGVTTIPMTFGSTPFESCVTGGTMSFGPISGRVRVYEIENASDRQLQVFWYSTTGERIKWATVDPGRPDSIYVLDGYWFLVADDSGNCLARVW